MPDIRPMLTIRRTRAKRMRTRSRSRNPKRERTIITDWNSRPTHSLAARGCDACHAGKRRLKGPEDDNVRSRDIQNIIEDDHRHRHARALP